MITITMNKDELTRIFERDSSKLEAFWWSKEKVLARQWRKDMRRDIVYRKTYDVRTKNADYKCVCIVGKNIRSVSFLMHIPESNEYIPITNTTCRVSEALQAISIHTFRRISERYYHDEDFDLNKTISRYYSAPLMGLVLYINKEDCKMVCATTGGLFLGIYDPTKHIMHVKTFISNDMLKGSQIEAVKRVSFILDSFPKKQAGSLQEADIIARKNSMLCCKADLDKVYEIYGEYFKDKKNAKQ
jgi:hypothetical protein